MNNQEMYEHILELRKYIKTLEQRIKVLEAKVDPPKTKDMGNGRIAFTGHGIRQWMDDLVGVHRQDPVTGEWKKIR